MMPDTLSLLTSDAATSVAALPLVTSALAQFQGDLTNSQHASVVSAAADALGIAAQSAQVLSTAGLIGHNDASNVEAGTALATDGFGLVAELQSFAARLKALVANII